MNREVDRIMEQARRIDAYGILNLDQAYQVLQKAKQNGENIYINFNGHKLYSLLDDEDMCYIKVTGLSKQEFDNRQKEYKKRLTEIIESETLQAKSKIPDWIKKGQALIYPQMFDRWETCVSVRAKDIYHGTELDNALEIMSILDRVEGQEGLDQAKQALDNANHSGTSYQITTSIVLDFSKRGPEFYREIYNSKILSEEDLELVEQICNDKAERNQAFEDAQNARE